MSLQPGTTVGNYEILGILGAGGVVVNWTSAIARR